MGNLSRAGRLAVALTSLFACGGGRGASVDAAPAALAATTDAATGPAAAELPASLVADPPPDRDNPARLDELQVPSGGVAMNAIIYVAAGAGPHPTAVLLHGWPGNEKNLDLAQSLRRAGWNVLFFHYRGAWGSPGHFSFAGALDDTRAALAFLRDPAVAAAHRVDPTRLVLVGHSLGGFLAAMVGAEDDALAGVVLLAAWNPGPDGAELASVSGDERKGALAQFRASSLPLAATAEELYDELVRHRDDWDLRRHAAALGKRRVLVVTADDGLAPGAEAVVQAMRDAGAREVTLVHVNSDHAFSDQRLRLQAEVLRWLGAR